MERGQRANWNSKVVCRQKRRRRRNKEASRGARRTSCRSFSTKNFRPDYHKKFRDARKKEKKKKKKKRSAVLRIPRRYSDRTCVYTTTVELDNRAELSSSVVARTLVLMARSFKFLAILRFVTFVWQRGWVDFKTPDSLGRPELDANIATVRFEAVA